MEPLHLWWTAVKPWGRSWEPTWVSRLYLSSEPLGWPSSHSQSIQPINMSIIYETASLLGVSVIKGKKDCLSWCLQDLSFWQLEAEENWSYPIEPETVCGPKKDIRLAFGCGGGAHPFPIHLWLSNYSRIVGFGVEGGTIATMGVYSISWINGVPQKSGFMVF